MDSETATAFNHAFAALGAGSAMWQGSHTYLGNQADNQLTSVVAFLIHHAIVGGLAETGGHLDIDHLINLQAQPRQRTVVQTASDITSIFTSQDISEWAQEFVDLDVPEYESTFVVIISSIITTMFPDRDATALLTGLTNIFRGNPEELNIYLPILRDLLVNLNLSDEKKFVLFWQLLGVACKMVFAFLWQEKVIQIDLFLEPGTNELGPKIMPPLVSLFNFVTEFEHVDESFQKFEGMFPGDKACRETVPHSKWHELSASAFDTVYLSDCLAAVVTGSDGSGSAHLSNLESSTEITRSEVSDWVNTNIVVPKIPIVKDVVPLFIEEIFMLFDLNDNDKIEWIDIEKTIDSVSDLVQPIIGAIEGFISRIENFCTDYSDCSTIDEFCNPLQFGCREKRENGLFPCIKDSQCYSDRCVDTTRICESKKSNGSSCLADKECLSDTCTGICGMQYGIDSGSDEWCNPN